MAQEVVEVHCVKMQTFERKIRPICVCFSKNKQNKIKTHKIRFTCFRAQGRHMYFLGPFSCSFLRQKKQKSLEGITTIILSPHIQIHVSMFGTLDIHQMYLIIFGIKQAPSWACND